MNRRTLLIAGALFLLLRTAEAHAAGVEYPNRSVQLIVPWAAGGGSDRLARILADGLQRRLGRPVIVVNRTGGAGAVGHTAGALAPPDGYTLTLATFELGTMHTLGISPCTWRDFAPVALLNGDAAAIFVRKDAPWRTLAELLDAARREPGRLKMSGTATGGAWDLARAGLLLAAGIPATNVLWIPAQGSAPALVELLGGHVDSVACSVPEASAQISGGQVRVLAVMSPQRLADFPDFPTAREQGIDYDGIGWRGLVAPKGTPPAIIERLSAAVTDVVASTEFREFVRKNGFTVTLRGPDEFAEFLRGQEEQWRKVIQGAGFESVGRNRDPGPYAAPIGIALLLVVGGAIEFARTHRAALSAAPRGEASKPAAAEAPSLVGGIPKAPIFLLAGLTVYLAVMPYIGFVVATLVFASALMLQLGARWWLALAGSGALVLGIRLLFVSLFNVPLP